MYELELSHKGDPNIVQAMADRMVNKTLKQIRDKRREPAYCRRRDQYLREVVSRLPLMRRCTRSSHRLSASISVLAPEDGAPSVSVSSGFDTPHGDSAAVLAEAVGNVGSREASSSRRAVESSDGEMVEPGELDHDAHDAAVPSGVMPLETHAIDLKECYIDLERCDRLVGSPPKLVEEMDDQNDDEAKWKEALVDSMREDDQSESLDGFTAVFEAIQLAVEDPTIDTVDMAYAAMIECLGAAQSDAQIEGRSTRVKNRTRRGLKRYQYARTQDLFKKDPGLLAKHVRLGTDHMTQNTVDVSRAEIRDLYNALWGTKVPTRILDFNETPSVGFKNFGPITAIEIKKRIARVKKSTAPGPDGIKRSALLGVHKGRVMAKFFNLILFSGILPSSWKQNRTSLIPKEGKDGTMATNYRPLTIGSLLGRLFWGIMDERLRSVVQISSRQKGFVAEAGCFANVRILHELTSLMKENKGGVGIQLDVSKAFDTVPHEAIPAALKRKGIPRPLVDLISGSYRGVTTKIAHPKGEIEIELRRGVKQGDPLSPLLFNLVLEPMLERLEGLPGYPLPENNNVSCLAFADDLFLFASDSVKAQTLLDCTVDELGALGMTIAANKSYAYQILPTRDSWRLVDPIVERIGYKIPVCTPENSLTYLGCSYSIWSGFSCDAMREEITRVIAGVMALRLKPMQKVSLLQTYLVPHYLYQLVIATPAKTLLVNIDQELRVAIKNILHLPQSICNGIIYCAKKDGGLGFPKLQELVPRVTLLNGLKFAESADPVIGALAECSRIAGRLKKLANSVRINYPYTKADIMRYKETCRKMEHKRWRDLTAQGRAVESFANDRIGNSFLHDPALLKPCRFTTALQLRTNTAGNKTSLNRAIPQKDLNCRKCRASRETLAHILGQCTHTKAARIRRHNDIRDYLEERVLERDKTAIISKEPLIPLAEGNSLKPDLIIKNQAGVNVVDVTVRHEDGDYLPKAKQEKIDKYKKLLPQLQQQFEVVKGSVLPIVIGTRGTMPKDTVAALAELGIKQLGELKTISLMALRSSIELYHAFIDYDGPIQ